MEKNLISNEDLLFYGNIFRNFVKSHHFKFYQDMEVIGYWKIIENKFVNHFSKILNSNYDNNLEDELLEKYSKPSINLLLEEMETENIPFSVYK